MSIQEANKSDIACDGTFIKLDLSYDHPKNNAGKSSREIKPSFGYVQQATKDHLKDLSCYGEVDGERLKMLMKEELLMRFSEVFNKITLRKVSH